MATGTLFFNDRDVETDFSFVVAQPLGGWPGGIGGASRLVPLIEGSEMQGAIVDPRNVRRQAANVTVKGIIRTGSQAAAMTALDAMREVLVGGEVRVRSGYAADRECLAMHMGVTGEPEVAGIADGNVVVTIGFQVKSGTARRLVPDGYALSTARTSCPIGTAESRPIILVHGGGAALTNPTITVRNAQGDVVMSMLFTLTLGATAALRIDCSRMQASVVTAGVVTDALAANDWTSGDFPCLRPYDSFISLGAFATVELSATGGTPVGEITYRRQYV